MNRIRYTAEDLGDPRFDDYFGHGLIDAYAALTTDVSFTYFDDVHVQTVTYTDPDQYSNLFYEYDLAGNLVKSTDAAGITYEYDAYDRVIKTTYTNGTYFVTTYWSDPAIDKQYDMYYGSDDAWQKTIQHWETVRNIMQYQWIADPAPATAGDEVYYIYDTEGNMLKKVFDNNDFVYYEYWTNDNMKYSFQYGAGGVWQKTIQYWEDHVGVMRIQWVADANPGTANDDAYYLYDTAGKMTRKYLDNNDFIIYEYWPNNNKKFDFYYGAGGVWQKSIQYWEDYAGIMQYQWVADENPGTPGDDVFYEHNTIGQVAKTFKDNGNFITTAYWANGNKSSDSYYEPGWAWIWANEYFENYQDLVEHY